VLHRFKVNEPRFKNMINYKLAKQLKDAGYPQIGLKYTWYYSTSPMGCYNLGEEYLDVKNYPDRIVIPTLSELIDACKVDHFVLHYDGRFGWSAYNFQGIGTAKSYKTPEEAVAKLWLKLNKKNAI